MAKIEILGSEFAEKLELQFAPSIKAGFPSPADDYLQDRLDFNRDLIRHPETTFYGRVSGDSMMDAGINDGDIAVIDKSIEASDGDIVVGYVNNEFTIKFLDLSHRAEGMDDQELAQAISNNDNLVIKHVFLLTHINLCPFRWPYYLWYLVQFTKAKGQTW